MNAAQKVDVLAVCPFCGHDDIRRDRTSPNNIGPIVYCDQCGAEALSVDAWNMRTPSAAVAELIEAKKYAFAVWNYISALYANDPSPDLKRALDNAWRTYSALANIGSAS